MNIGDWMETPSGARIVGYAFGFGAAVVIVGALFKIQHWPGASVILTAGMGTEAVLFAITAFGKPHKTYHWDNVFPQLKEEEEAEMEGFSTSSFGGGGGGNVNITGGTEGGTIDLSGVPSLSEDDVQKLSDGISRLSETASQLSELGSLKGVTDKFIDSLTSATNNVSSFASNQAAINTSSAALVSSYQTIASEMSTASQSSSEYLNIVKGINKSLVSVNAVYELQLKEVDGQAKAIQMVNAELGKVKDAVSQSLVSVEAYKTETTKLTKQVSDLNSVYGNMLNAVA
ncbi:MAG: gliding motility protein GldL [Prevotellaceae bacterium]|jgi:gliding motility-associated protein GldL|nr:gliding motility protein GldL [Prevotellaceae bacterium]